jgi:hypothetical protein
MILSDMGNGMAAENTLYYGDNLDVLKIEGDWQAAVIFAKNKPAGGWPK